MDRYWYRSDPDVEERLNTSGSKGQAFFGDLGVFTAFQYPVLSYISSLTLTYETSEIRVYVIWFTSSECVSQMVYVFLPLQVNGWYCWRVEHERAYWLLQFVHVALFTCMKSCKLFETGSASLPLHSTNINMNGCNFFVAPSFWSVVVLTQWYKLIPNWDTLWILTTTTKRGKVVNSKSWK